MQLQHSVSLCFIFSLLSLHSQAQDAAQDEIKANLVILKQSSDYSDRKKAVNKLKSLHIQDPDVAIELGHALDVEREDTNKHEVLGVLESMGEAAKPAAEQLQKMAIFDHSIFVRKRAAGILGKLGESGKKAALDFAKILTDKSQEDLQVYALEAFGAMGESKKGAISFLEKAVSEAAPEQKQVLALALAQTGQQPSQALVQELNQMLSSKWLWLSEQAISAIGSLGEFSRPFHSKLLEMALKNPDTHTNSKVMESLWRINILTPEIRAQILAGLRSRDKKINRSTLRLVKVMAGKLKGDPELSKKITQELFRLTLETQEESILDDLAAAFSNLVNQSEQVLHLLVQAQNPKLNSEYRCKMLSLLMTFHEQMEQVAPALASLALYDKNRSVREKAHDFFYKMEATRLSDEDGVKIFVMNKKNLPILAQALKSENWEIRLRALNISWDYTFSEDEIKDLLIPLLKDKKASIRDTVVLVLGKKFKSADCIPLLTTALHDPYPDVRANAAVALASLYRNKISLVKEVVPELVHALDDSYDKVRESVVCAISTIGDEGGLSAPKIVKMAMDAKDLSPRMVAIGALARLGDSAKSVLPHLFLDLQSSYRERRERAVQVLSSMKNLSENILGHVIGLLMDPKISTNVRSAARQVLEEHLGGKREEISEVNKLLKSALQNASTQNKNLCEILCGLVEKRTLWDQNDSVPAWSSLSTVPWKGALLSLEALFLVQAAPYCEKIRDLVSEIKSNLLQASKECSTDFKSQYFPEIRTLYRNLLLMLQPGSAIPWSSAEIYAKIFYLQLQRSMQLPKIEIEKTEHSLEKDLENYKDKIRGKQGGSAFNTFALSAALIADPTPPDAALEALRQVYPGLQDPMDIPYHVSLGLVNSKNMEGANGRAVLFYLALLTKDRSSPVDYRKHLIDALKFYDQQMPRLMAHVLLTGFHQYTDANNAPYYFYASIPYVTAAIQMLSKNATGDELKELEKMRESITKQLLFFLTEDGTFVPESAAEGDYQSSPAYVNPLAGLALLPLLQDSCNGTPAGSLGILGGE